VDFTRDFLTQSEGWSNETGSKLQITVPAHDDQSGETVLEFSYQWDLVREDLSFDNSPESPISPSTPISKFKQNVRKRKQTGNTYVRSTVDRATKSSDDDNEPVSLKMDPSDILPIGPESPTQYSHQSQSLTTSSQSAQLTRSTFHRQNESTSEDQQVLKYEHEQRIRQLESELKQNESHYTHQLQTAEIRYTDEIQHLNMQYHQKLQKLQQQIHHLEQDKIDLNHKMERAIENEKLLQGQKFGKMVHKSKKEQDKLLNDFRLLQDKNHEQEKLILELNQLIRDKGDEFGTVFAENSSLKQEIQQLRKEKKSQDELYQSQLDHEMHTCANLENQFKRQCDELNDKIFHLEQSNQQLKQDSKLNDEKLTVLREQMFELTNKNHALEKQLEQEDLDLSKTYKRLSDVQKINEMLKTELQVAKAELNRTQEALASTKDEHQREYKSTSREMQLLKDRLEQMTNIHEQNLEEEQHKYAAKIQKMQREHAADASTLQDLQEKYDMEITKRIEAVEKIQNLKNEIIVLRNEANEGKSQLQQHVQSQSELSAMIDSMKAEKRRVDSDLNQSSIKMESQKSTVQKLTRDNAQLQRQLSHAQREYDLLEMQDKQRQKQLLVQHERIRILEKNITMMEEQEMNYKQDIDTLNLDLSKLQELNASLRKKYEDYTAEREKLEFESRNNNTILDEQQDQIDELTRNMESVESKMNHMRSENSKLKQRIEEVKQSAISERKELITKHKQVLSQIENDLEVAREEQQQSMLNLEVPLRRLIQTLGIEEMSLERKKMISPGGTASTRRDADRTLFGTTNALPNTTIVIHEPKVSHVHSLNESDITSHQSADETVEFVHRGLSHIEKAAQRLVEEQNQLHETCDNLRRTLQQREIRVSELEQQIDTINIQVHQQVKEEKSQLMTQLETLETQMHVQESSNIENDRKLQSLELKLDETQSQMHLEQERHNRQISDLHEQLQEERERAQRAELDLNRTKKVHADLERTIKSLQQDYTTAIEARENAEAERRSLVQRLDAENNRFKQSQNALKEEMRVKVKELQSRVAKLESEAELHQEEMQSMRDTVEFSESQRNILLRERESAQESVASLREQLVSLQINLKRSVDDLQQIEKINKSLEKTLEKVQQKLSIKEDELSEMSSQNHDLHIRFEKDKGSLMQQLKSRDQEIFVSNTRVRELNEQVENLTLSQKEYRAKNDELHSKVDKLSQQLEQMEQSHKEEKSAHQNQFASLESQSLEQIASLETQLGMSKEHAKDLQTQIDKNIEEHSSLARELASLKTHLSEHAQENASLLAQLEETKHQLDQSQSELIESQMVIKSQQSDISMLNIQISSLKDDHLDSREKYDELENILEQTRKNHEDAIASKMHEHTLAIQNFEVLLHSSDSLVKEWKSKCEVHEQHIASLQLQEESTKMSLDNVKNNYNDAKAALYTREMECEALKEQVQQIHQQYASVKSNLDLVTETEQKNSTSLRTMISNLKSSLEEKEKELESRNGVYDSIERKMQVFQQQSEQTIANMQEELNEKQSAHTNAVRTLECKNVECDKVNEALEKSEHELQKLTVQHKELQEQFSTLNVTHQSLNVQLETVRSSAESSKEELEQKVAELNGLVAHHQQKLEDIQERTSESHELLSDRQQQIDSLTDSLQEAQHKNEQLYEEISEIQTQYRQQRIQLENNIEDVQSEYERFREETTLLIESKQEEIANLSASVASLRAEFERSQEEKLDKNRTLQQELKAKRNEVESLCVDLVEVRRSHDEVASQLQDHHDRHKSLMNQLEEMDSENTQKQEEIYDLQREVKKLAAVVKNSAREHQAYVDRTVAELNLKENKVVALDEENRRMRDVLETTESKLKRCVIFEEKYRELSDELTSEQAEHLKTKRLLQNATTNLDDTLEQLEAFRLQSDQRIQSLQERVDEQQRTLNNLSSAKKDNSELKQQIQQLDDALCQKSCEILHQQEQQAEFEVLQQNHSLILVEVERLRTELVAQTRETEQMRTDYDTKCAQLGEHADRVKRLEAEYRESAVHKEYTLMVKKRIKKLQKSHNRTIAKVHEHFSSQIHKMDDRGALYAVTKQELDQLRVDFGHATTNLQSHQARVQQLETDNETLRRNCDELENTVNDMLEEAQELRSRLREQHVQKEEAVRLSHQKIDLIRDAYEKRVHDLKFVHGPILTPRIVTPSTSMSSNKSLAIESVYEARVNALRHELDQRTKELRSAKDYHSSEIQRLNKRFRIREESWETQLQHCVKSPSQDCALVKKVSQLQDLCQIEQARCEHLKMENVKLRDEIVYLRQNCEEWNIEKKHLQRTMRELEHVNVQLDAHHKKLEQGAPNRLNERISHLRAQLSAQKVFVAHSEQREKQLERKCASLQERLEKQILFSQETKVRETEFEEIERLTKHLHSVIVRDDKTI